MLRVIAKGGPTDPAKAKRRIEEALREADDDAAREGALPQPAMQDRSEQPSGSAVCKSIIQSKNRSRYAEGSAPAEDRQRHSSMREIQQAAACKSC